MKKLKKLKYDYKFIMVWDLLGEAGYLCLQSEHDLHELRFGLWSLSRDTISN